MEDFNNFQSYIFIYKILNITILNLMAQKGFINCNMFRIKYFTNFCSLVFEREII